MCMEDKKIGRNISTNVTLIGALSPRQRIASGKPDRIGIAFAGSGVDIVQIIPEQLGSASTGGFRLTTASPNLLIDIEQYGTIVTGEWFADDAGSASPVTVIEMFLEARKSSELR